ncbi:hypothetical protein HYPSUDRAFT_218088, partial [Hypholoma sublateritium FD-334 SS-4]
MKFIPAILVVAMVSAATVSAAGTFSVSVFTSGFCASSSTLISTTTGIEAASGTCISFPLAMASVDLIMSGTCATTTFFSDAACTDPSDTDIGTPFN